MGIGDDMQPIAHDKAGSKQFHARVAQGMKRTYSSDGHFNLWQDVADLGSGRR